MSSAATHQSNDAYARSMGYPDAATMIAWRQRQLERTAPQVNALSQPLNSDTIRQALALHPAILFQNILDKWNAVMP